MPIMRKLSINQVDQMTPLVTPVAFRVSLRRSSFSSTILLTIMDTEQTQASTMKMGKQRFNVSMKLNREGEIRWRRRTQLVWLLSVILFKVTKLSSYFHSQIIHITRVWHLLQVNTHRPLLSCLSLDDPMLYYVLEVSKAAPNIAEIIHRICSGARVPIPEQHIYFIISSSSSLY